MRYTLVQIIDGQFVSSTFDGDDVYTGMEIRGYEFTGLNTNTHNRAELQEQPKFAGVCGPMWNGDGIRYECPKTYDILSS